MIVCLGTTPTLARTMEFARLDVGGVNRAASVREYAAGKAVNTARAIATLGEMACVVGTRGGTTGGRFSHGLHEIAGYHDLIEVSAPTRLCVTVLDDASATSTELIEESGALTTAEGEALLAALARRLVSAKACVLAGSLAPGLAADFYAECVDACRHANVRVVLDASREPLRHAIDRRPDFVKLNAGELATVVPPSGDPVRDARTLAERTGEWVIVTRGRAPTIAVHAGGDAGFLVDVPRVDVVSPIGSGDSFAGGLAVGVARELSMADALRLATACASANAMTADAAHFELEKVEELMERVVVEAT